MRHSLLSLPVLLLAATPLVGFADSPADELPKMVGKSAEELAKEHGPTLKSLTKATNDNPFAPTPWHVWKFSTPKNEARYVVFSGQQIFVIPGTSSARVHLVSSSGADIGSWSFSTGWRIDIQSAAMSFDQKLQAPVIMISSVPVINGRDVGKQYFALVDDKLYFMRMEDSRGTLIRNDYLSPNHTLGGQLPAKDVAGWSALLASRELPLRLAALTYLSGTHMDPDSPRKGVASESVEEAKIARAFRTADSTQNRIVDYRHSDNAWLKEAADLAALPPDESY